MVIECFLQCSGTPNYGVAMKKIFAIAVVIMLSLPCAAQAYYFQINEGTGSFGDYLKSTDQVFFNVDYLTSSSKYDRGMRGTFVLYSDVGTDVVTDVDVQLTLNFNNDIVENDLVFSAGTSYKTNILNGSGEVVHSEAERDNSFGWDAFETDYFQLTTGTEYSFEFLTSIYDFDGFGFVNLDVVMVVTSDEFTPTPIPGAVWLLGSGLVGLVGLRKRFAKK